MTIRVCTDDMRCVCIDVMRMAGCMGVVCVCGCRCQLCVDNDGDDDDDVRWWCDGDDNRLWVMTMCGVTVMYGCYGYVRVRRCSMGWCGCRAVGRVCRAIWVVLATMLCRWCDGYVGDGGCVCQCDDYNMLLRAACVYVCGCICVWCGLYAMCVCACVR